MGYGSYDTPHGPAGYLVEDTCHVDGCEARIDRGLAYLCGDHPVSPSEGCGWWFCGEHLFMWARSAQSLCGTCLDQALKDAGLCCVFHDSTAERCLSGSLTCCWECPDLELP